MKTLTEKYRAIQENRYTKAQFLRDARLGYPQLITQFNGYDDAVTILKSKGMISEISDNTTITSKVDVSYINEADSKKEYKYQGHPRYSLNALERGIDFELEKMGLNSALAPKEEELEKAKKTAIKNLEKNPNHYLELIAGDHLPKGKESEMVASTKSNTVDKQNSMVKVKLKEAVKTLIVNALNESNDSNDIITEANLTTWLEKYSSFKGLPEAIGKLDELIEEISEHKQSAVNKLTEIFKEVGETVTNPEGIKVGAFLTPGLVEAFKKSLQNKIGLHSYEPTSIPKVKVLSKKEFDDLKNQNSFLQTPLQENKRRFNLEGKIF